MFGSDIRAYCRGSGRSRSGDLTSFEDINWLSHASSIYPGAFKRRAYDLSYHCNDFIVTQYLENIGNSIDTIRHEKTASMQPKTKEK